MADEPVGERLARLEEKFDGVANHVSEIRTRLGSIEGRLTALEVWQARVVGYAAGAGAVAGLVATGVALLLMRLLGV